MYVHTYIHISIYYSYIYIYIYIYIYLWENYGAYYTPLSLLCRSKRRKNSEPKLVKLCFKLT